VSALEVHGDDVVIRVRVQPKASQSRLRVEEDGRVRVALTAPPVDGAANKALCAFLAGYFGLPKRAVTLESGHKSREKAVRLAGIQLNEAKRRLAGNE
jgi:uncharacterized protein (TIGR00251 family)